MKGLIKILNAKILLIGLFSFAAVAANAQVVSKGVQKYANKSAYENAQKKQINIRSVEAPIAVSKGVHQIGGSNVEPSAKGNLISKGYPYWTLAKGVNHQHKRNELNTDFISRNK